MECEYLSTIRLLTYLLLINYTSAIKKCWKVSVASCCGPLSCGPVWSGKVYPVSEGLNSGNACHYSVQNPCSCDLLFKNMQITTYRIIILPVVLYESLTLREEHKLRVLENRLLRGMFSSTGMDLTRVSIKLQNKEFHDLPISLEYWSQEECRGKGPINEQVLFISIVVQIYLKYL